MQLLGFKIDLDLGKSIIFTHGQFFENFLILKAEQQNALEVIFRKVDVDGNNQLDKAWFPIMTPLSQGYVA